MESKRSIKAGYGPAVFSKMSRSSTPTTTSTTKSMLPTGPNTVDMPEASQQRADPRGAIYDDQSLVPVSSLSFRIVFALRMVIFL